MQTTDRLERVLLMTLAPACALAAAASLAGSRGPLESAGRLVAGALALVLAYLLARRSADLARSMLPFLLTGAALLFAFAQALAVSLAGNGNTTTADVTFPIALPQPTGAPTSAPTASAAPTAAPTQAPAAPGGPAAAPLTIAYDPSRPCAATLPATGPAAPVDRALDDFLVAANLGEFDFLLTLPVSPLVDQSLQTASLRDAAGERLGGAWRAQAFDCLYAAAIYGSYRAAGLRTDRAARDQVRIRAACAASLGSDVWWVRSEESYPPAIDADGGRHVVRTSPQQAYVIERTAAGYRVVGWQPVPTRECAAP